MWFHRLLGPIQHRGNFVDWCNINRLAQLRGKTVSGSYASNRLLLYYPVLLRLIEGYNSVAISPVIVIGGHSAICNRTHSDSKTETLFTFIVYKKKVSKLTL